MLMFSEFILVANVRYKLLGDNEKMGMEYVDRAEGTLGMVRLVYFVRSYQLVGSFPQSSFVSTYPRVDYLFLCRICIPVFCCV